MTRQTWERTKQVLESENKVSEINSVCNLNRLGKAEVSISEPEEEAQKKKEIGKTLYRRKG